MALLRIDHVPETVKVNSPLYVILPDPGRIGEMPLARRKVLYLLHGLSDDSSAWQRYTSIEPLAPAGQFALGRLPRFHRLDSRQQFALVVGCAAPV